MQAQQQFIPGTVDPLLADLAEAKERLAECEKNAASAKRAMQQAALQIAERVAARLVSRTDTPADITQMCADYLSGRQIYLTSATDGGKAAQTIIDAIRAEVLP